MSDEKQIKDHEDQSLVEMEAYRTGEENVSVVTPDSEVVNDLEKISALFKASKPDPAEIPEPVDNFVLGHIKEKSREIRRDRKVVRLFPRYKWAAASAMALMVCVISFHYINVYNKSAGSPPKGISSTMSQDLDRNGRIDIIDAYLLNRSLKNGSTVSKQLDLNSDGLFNNKDVDNIAYTAVSLKRSEV